MSEALIAVAIVASPACRQRQLVGSLTTTHTIHILKLPSEHFNRVKWIIRFRIAHRKVQHATLATCEYGTCSALHGTTSGPTTGATQHGHRRKGGQLGDLDGTGGNQSATP
jgi:hypothetical protein